MSKTIDDCQRRTNGPAPEAADVARPGTGEPDCNRAGGSLTMGVARQAPGRVER
jgi:hypothetical protein